MSPGTSGSVPWERPLGSLWSFRMEVRGHAAWTLPLPQTAALATRATPSNGKKDRDL